MTKNDVKELKKLTRVALGGAAAIKGIDVIGHRGDPTALSHNIAGFASLGAVGAAAAAAVGLNGRKPKRR